MADPIVKKSDHLYGIKHWAQWFPFNHKPRFQIFVYCGTQHSHGTHWFYARSNPKVMVSKSIYQLNVNGFVPFVIDLKKVEEYCNSQGYDRPDNLE